MLLLLELLLPLPEFGLLPNIKRNRMVSGCCRDISTALRTLFDLFETLCATGAVRVFGYTRVVVACIRWWRESVVWGGCLRVQLCLPRTVRWSIIHNSGPHSVLFKTKTCQTNLNNKNLNLKISTKNLN